MTGSSGLAKLPLRKFSPDDEWRQGRRDGATAATRSYPKCLARGGIAMVLLGAAPPLPDQASGLTCTAANGAVLRLNIDPSAGQFQKEGLPAVAIRSKTGRRLVLMRVVSGDMLVEATLDRVSLVYTARSRSLGSPTVTTTSYQCVIGPPFLVGEGN